VYTKGRNKVFNKRYYSSEPKFVPDDVKIVILVDEGSASASEIFTGVMKDYKRATIIGTRTYGKGLVQQIFNLPDHSAIILTVSQYFTPDGYQINKNGIEPDIIVKEYELSENDKFKITILMRENYIKDFVSKYGKNYTDNDFNKFKAFLKNKNLLVDDFILRKMIFNEIHRDDVDLLYTLEYDLQLKAAYKEIKKELSE
jgi:carboxyl-terminal processing protease